MANQFQTMACVIHKIGVYRRGVQLFQQINFVKRQTNPYTIGPCIYCSIYA